MFSLWKKKPLSSPTLDVVTRPHVFPRVKTPAFLAAAAELPGMTPAQMPISRPIAGDLLLTFAVDEGSAYVSLTPAMCDRFRMEKAPGVLWTYSMMTLITLMHSGLKAEAFAGEAFRLTIEPDLDACSILVDDLWNKFAAQLAGMPVAIFPHRNLVYFTASHNAEGMNVLRTFMSQVDFTDTHALSRHFYRWQDRAWQVHDA